jgi:hypothetical protein
MNPGAYEAGMMARGRHPQQLNSGIAQQRNDMLIQQMAEEREQRIQQLADAEKSADFFVKASPAALAGLGMDEKSWKLLGAREKTAAVSGLIQKQAMEQAAAKFQEVQRQRQAQNALAAAIAQAGKEGPITEESFTKALAQNQQAINAPGTMGLLEKALGAKAGGRDFFNRQDVGKLIPVEGAEGYGLAVTGPNQSQAFFTGKARGSSIPVPGVGDVGVIEGKPGQITMIPGQQTQGQIREQLAKAEADIAKLKTKLKADPELSQYLGGALAEQESLAASYREALGSSKAQSQKPKVAPPEPGEVRGGYRFKGGNPKDKANWEAVQ